MNNQKTFAILGATQNREKYGWKITNNLKKRKLNVIPINPKYEYIEGLKCYKNVDSITSKIDYLIVVIPPSNALLALKDIRTADIGTVWFQPGAESEENIDYCKNRGWHIISGECIMINTPSSYKK